MTDVSRRNESDHGSDPAVRALTVLWAKRLRLVGLAFVGGVLAVALSFLIPAQYRSTATLLPQVGGGESGLLSALGSFANIPVDGQISVEDLYPDILRSDRLLDRVIDGRAFPEGDDSLYEILGVAVEEGDSIRSARRLKKVLRERVLAFHRDRDTGLMGVSATMPRSPDHASAMANLFTDELCLFVEDFNRDRTLGKLGYLSRRISDVALELAEAESDLADYLSENRGTESSPRLRIDAGVKERRVQALTAVWVELVRQHEIAKMDDNETVYAVDVLDRASPPLRKVKPSRAGMGIVGAVLVFMLASVFYLARDVVAGHSQDS